MQMTRIVRIYADIFNLFRVNLRESAVSAFYYANHIKKGGLVQM
jgi:hypothetical protein